MTDQTVRQKKALVEYYIKKSYDKMIKDIISTFSLRTTESIHLAIQYIDEQIADIKKDRDNRDLPDYAISRLEEAKTDMRRQVIVPRKEEGEVNIATQTNNISSMAAAVNGGPEAVTAANCGVSPERAKELNESVHYFTESNGKDTQLRNMVNRGEIRDKEGKWYIPEGEEKEQLMEHINNIEEMIARAPKWNGGPTYRGLAVSQECIMAWEENGQGIGMLGMASWSRDKKVAMHYASICQSPNNPIRVICICEGKQNGTSIEYLAMKEIEKEILCSNNSRYNIIKITKKDDYLEMIVKQTE